MRKFLRNILVLVMLVTGVLVCSLLFIPDRVSAKSLLGALSDKHAILAKTHAPKVIFVGGSNISFGLDSRAVSAALRMPVVNTGLHGGLGLKYALDDCLPYVQAGDVVVVVPEYENYYTSNFLGEVELVSVLFDIDRNGMQYVSPEQWCHLLPYLPTYSAKKLKNLLFSPFEEETDASQPTIYDRHSFNEYGDACLHWCLPNQPYLHSKKVSPSSEPDTQTLAYIMNFKEQVGQKRASCLILPPVIDSSSFANQLPVIRKVAASLPAYALHFAGKPERYALPDSLFFNSYYHLNKAGVDLRTKLVVEDIRNRLPQSKK